MDMDLLPAPSHIIGPVWRKTVDGSWYLPERSLGWGVIAWMTKFVNTPSGGGESPERMASLIDLAEQGAIDRPNAFVPTDEQMRFIVWWYAVDERGNYCYRNGVFRRMKGAGKDPLGAALALAELCGPVAFSHFDSNGEAVGMPRHMAWIQIIAVSQDQTKNTFRLFPVMISKQLKETYGLDVNKFIIYSPIGGIIEANTSSPASMEGNRPTLCLLNETQNWVDSTDGHELANVIEGNVTKIPGSRSLAICNAHIPGLDSQAERDYETWQDVQSGKAVDVGNLYDALEAPAGTPVSEIPSEKEDPEGYRTGVQKLREGIRIAAGDSYWLPIDEIVKSVLDTRNPISESRRKFLNQVNAHEDSWIAPNEWGQCTPDVSKGDEPLRPLTKGDRVTLGFDGSKSNDWSALVACRVDDAALFVIAVWDPEKHGGEVPRADVDATVRSSFERYDVVAFRADVKEFEAYVDQWGQDFKRKIKVNASPGNPVAYDMRGQQKRFSLDCERFLDAVLERELVHDNNPILRQHILNARRHPTTYDTISIRKQSKDSSRKIDCAVCAVISFGARQEFLMSKRNRSGKATVIR